MKNAAYAHIPGSLRALLHQMVYSQDAGFPLVEELLKQKFDSSFIDRLMVACDNERLTMRHGGIPVYARASNRPLILGLEERPFKQPHQCIQHDPTYSVAKDPETGESRDVCYCRFCGTELDMNPSEEDSQEPA